METKTFPVWLFASPSEEEMEGDDKDYMLNEHLVLFKEYIVLTKENYLQIAFTFA